MLPTHSISEKNQNLADIGVCVLSNVNQAKVTLKELPFITELLVRFLDWNMDKQSFPTMQSELSVRNYRSLGIGFSNHAYWLAKQKLKYGEQKALDKLHEWVESFQYNLIKASITLAKEFGKAPYFDRTYYSKGEISFNESVDTLISIDYKQDWASLKKEIMEYGMRNCVLSAIPPSETSSIIGNQTSGLEPIRDLMTIKDGKTLILKQFAPEAIKLADKYDYAFVTKDITSRYLKHMAIVQKFIDQSISINTFYNPELYENTKIDIKDIIKDIFLAKKLGLKGLYYNNVFLKDNQTINTGCVGGGCEV
jgi:ribonucleoside-diphosphate reductase alpha chain